MSWPMTNISGRGSLSIAVQNDTNFFTGTSLTLPSYIGKTSHSTTLENTL